MSLLQRRILMIPEKKSKKWFQVFISYFLILIIALILSRFLVGTPILINIIVSLVILALFSAIIPCIGGFWGRRIFFYIYTLINFFAILYMMFIVVTDASPGWNDITSMIVYLFITILGLIVAFIIDFIYFLISRRRTQS